MRTKNTSSKNQEQPPSTCCGRRAYLPSGIGREILGKDATNNTTKHHEHDSIETAAFREIT